MKLRRIFPTSAGLACALVGLLFVSLAALGAVDPWSLLLEPFGANLGVDTQAEAAWGDYNNDGYMDLAVIGQGATRRLVIYKNNGDSTVTNVCEPMGANLGLNYGALCWGDYDRDGDLDLAAVGNDGTNLRCLVFRNNGNDSFTPTAEPLGANRGVEKGDVAWGDYDNDGELDLAVVGDTGTRRRFLIYHNSGGAFTLAAEPMGVNLGLDDAEIAWGDYDNDGDFDLLAGGRDVTATERLLVYRNDGGGTFTLASQPMGVNAGLRYASIAWGDFTGDGKLDFACAGYDGSNYRLIVYRNDGSDSFNLMLQPMGVDLGVINGGLAWGDWDNDGDADLMVTGYDNIGSNCRSLAYENNGAGSLFLDYQLFGTNQGTEQGNVALGDFTNDGRLDAVITGFDSLANRRFTIWRGDAGSANYRRPSPPVTVSATKVTDTICLLRWSASVDSTTPAAAMQYDVRVGTTSNGVNIVPADTNSADSVGWRLIGNVPGCTTSFRLTGLSASNTYYWSVQAINGSMRRSTWSAETTFQLNPAVSDTHLPVERVVTASDTRPAANAPCGATDSYVQINMSGGGTTGGTLKNSTDDTGTGANYSETSTLANAFDTIFIPIWTNQSSMRLFVGLRSDTGTLDTNSLPPGIANTDTGRQAFGATIVMLEYADSTGNLIGDTQTTSAIGDSFAYTLRYFLSETTARLYNNLGFDTAPGSRSFAFYYADTYGGRWVRDTTVTVTVTAAPAPWYLCVTVKGITKDLPGGVGGAGAADSGGGSAGGCLITRWGVLPGDLLAWLRWCRDLALETCLGRLVTSGYYSLSGLV